MGISDLAQALPAEGQPVVCHAHNPIPGAIYRFTNGKLRHYTNPDVANSYEGNWGAVSSINCANIALGPAMPKKPYVGQSVQCASNGFNQPGAVYRYDGAGYLNHYPNPPIAGSWNGHWWADIAHIDCTGFARGPDMPHKSAAHAYNEGQAIQCSNGGGAIFRYSSGFLRWYPNPPIASSWDGHWGAFIHINCDGLTRGPDMPLRVRASF